MRRLFRSRFLYPALAAILAAGLFGGLKWKKSRRQAKAELAKFKVSLGPKPKSAAHWKVKLLASAPELVHPTVLCTAPDGRLFVAQDPMDMGNSSTEPTDSILCFHPDGKVTTFATKLHAVFGLAYLDGKLFVHHCPQVSVFRDDQGVGRDRQELFTTNPEPASSGFNDHLPSNLRLAMDGYFYMSTGDKGIIDAVGRDGSKAELHGGGILRFRPDGTELEVYCTGTRNHLDVAINAEDELFTYDNTDDGNGWETRVTHMVDGGYYGYPFDYKPQRPYTLWMMDDFGHGAPTAAISYNEDALPLDYRGNLFLSEWGRREVLRLKVFRSGGTYQIAKRVRPKGDDFLNERLAEFRPIGLAWAPDGMSLYVADWNFPGWKSPQSVGRLFKVTFRGLSLAAPKPAWWLAAALGGKGNASIADLIFGLRHPAQSVRLVAQRRLAERGMEGEPSLAALLHDSSAPAYARWHAIWALDAMDGGQAARHDILAVAAKDPDLTVRSQAFRQLGTRRVKEAVPALVVGLKDGNASLRFRAATALGRIGDGAAVAPLLQALDEKDLFARYAAFTALNRIGRATPSAWKEIAQGLRDSRPAVRDGTLFALRETFEPNVAAELSAFATSPQSEPTARAAALSVLAGLHHRPVPWDGHWWGTQPVRGAPAPKTVEWAGTTQVLASLRQALRDPAPQVRLAAVNAVGTADDHAAASELRQMFVHESEIRLKQALLATLGSLQDAETGPLLSAIFAHPAENKPYFRQAVEAAGRIKDPAALNVLAKITEAVTDEDTLLTVLAAVGEAASAEAVPSLTKLLHHPNEKVSFAAGQALANIGGEAAQKVVLPLLGDRDPGVVRAAIHAAGLMHLKEALPQLMALYRNPATRDAAIVALEAVPDLAALDIYLEALADSSDAVRELGRSAIHSLHVKALPLIEDLHRKKPFTGRALAELQRTYHRDRTAQRGPLFAGEVKPASVEEYARFAAATQGDPEMGRKIFENVIRCNVCHAVGGNGGQIGPDLAGIGAKYARATLIESVLYPSKQIFDGYRATVVTLKNGNILMGFIRDEKESEFQVLDAAGQKRPVRKDQVAKREESNISLMPEGMQAGMTLNDFANLIAYLESLNEVQSLKAQSGT